MDLIEEIQAAQVDAGERAVLKKLGVKDPNDLTDEVIGLLRNISSQFRHYEFLHLKKGTQEGREKADINGGWACAADAMIKRLQAGGRVSE